MLLKVMLRIYFPQQWSGLSDSADEESLYDLEAMFRLQDKG
jgi:IS5 family transposase